MRINRTGKIFDDFYVLGNPGGPVYLLDGSYPVLFDAGFSALAPVYEQDIKKVLGSRAPAYLFLTHSHFDHIGAAGYFKTVWPEIQIAGSAGTQKILARPSAVQLIRTLNQEMARQMRSWGTPSIHKASFKLFDLDLVLTPGQTIELGQGLNVKAIHTPGHTWDFMSYWVAEKRILVASEAVGCDDGSGYISTEFLVDYDAYRSSLKGLAQLDPQILCPGHLLVLTGSHAKEYMRRSLEQAEDYVAMVEGFLREEGGNLERVVARVKALEWDPKPWPKQIESAYVLNTQAKVKKLWERGERAEKGRGK